MIFDDLAPSQASRGFIVHCGKAGSCYHWRLEWVKAGIPMRKRFAELLENAATILVSGFMAAAVIGSIYALA